MIVTLMCVSKCVSEAVVFVYFYMVFPVKITIFLFTDTLTHLTHLLLTSFIKNISKISLLKNNIRYIRYIEISVSCMSV